MRFLADEGKLTNLSERQRFAPYGVFGGKPGRLARTVINPGPGEQLVHGKQSREFAYGDVISFQQSGAGGYGDPLERDPARVLDDVLDDYVSIEAAARRVRRRDHGDRRRPPGRRARDRVAAERAEPPMIAFTAEQEKFRRTVARFVDAEVVPQAAASTSGASSRASRSSVWAPRAGWGCATRRRTAAPKPTW